MLVLVDRSDVVVRMTVRVVKARIVCRVQKEQWDEVRDVWTDTPHTSLFLLQNTHDAHSHHDLRMCLCVSFHTHCHSCVRLFLRLFSLCFSSCSFPCLSPFLAKHFVAHTFQMEFFNESNKENNIRDYLAHQTVNKREHWLWRPNTLHHPSASFRMSELLLKCVLHLTTSHTKWHLTASNVDSILKSVPLEMTFHRIRNLPQILSQLKPIIFVHRHKLTIRMTLTSWQDLDKRNLRRRTYWHNKDSCFWKRKSTNVQNL